MREVFWSVCRRLENAQCKLHEVDFHGFSSGSTDFKKEVSDKLVAGFADDEKMVRLISMVTRGAPGAHVPELLKSLADKSTDQSVQGNALMSLASFYTMAGQIKPRLDDEGFAARIPQDVAEYLQNFDEEAHADEVASIYERIVADFSDVSGGRGGTLGDRAESELFVLNHLSVGKTAPDITGEDLDGEEFKLSDYRGKVVLLDFWGDW